MEGAEALPAADQTAALIFRQTQHPLLHFHQQNLRKLQKRREIPGVFASGTISATSLVHALMCAVCNSGIASSSTKRE
jgi:hypothetical protein